MSKRVPYRVITSLIILGINSALALFLSSEYLSIRKGLVFPVVLMFLLVGMIAFLISGLGTMRSIFGDDKPEPPAETSKEVPSYFKITSVKNVVITGQDAQILRDTILIIYEHGVEHFMNLDDISTVEVVSFGKSATLPVDEFIRKMRGGSNE